MRDYITDLENDIAELREALRITALALADHHTGLVTAIPFARTYARDEEILRKTGRILAREEKEEDLNDTGED